KTRSVFREVNSGGSFGSNPLMQHIGIGAAVLIKNIEITWPGSKTVQQLNDVPADQHIVVTENRNEMVTVRHNKIDFAAPNLAAIGCAPAPVHKH
ncbi:MAG: CRTAC1 family protein, partial [Chitinophagaceae bacterium]